MTIALHAMSLWVYTQALLCASAVALMLYKSTKSSNPHRLPLPPGPKGWPVIGNLLDALAFKQPWISYEEWGKRYGDIFHYRVMGQSVLVLTSPGRVSDLLEKRSAIYSGRPQTTMIRDLLRSSEWALSIQEYGPNWRRHRRAVHEQFRPTSIEEYKPIVKRESRRLLRRLLESPQDFKNHVKLSFASSIFDIVYGIRVDDLDHPQIQDGERVTRELTIATVPGSYLVDSFPILKYVPDWMPGAHFKRMAKTFVELQSNVINLPFSEMIQNLRSGQGISCMAAKLYTKLPSREDPLYEQQLDVAKNAAAVNFLAGADTTVSSILTFILAMVLHPEVAKKAHEEIDSVVGRSRLPDFGDRENLVYVAAVVKETMRWQAVTPIGVPHLLIEDDEYDGFFIPKGTIVVPNTWSILHDEEAYPDPFSFNPERFIKNGKQDLSIRDPASAAFGFGRRVCPGRHLGMESIWVAISGLLAVYEILPPTHGDPPQCKMTNAIISHPEDYECRIVPRSKDAANLINSLSWEAEE